MSYVIIDTCIGCTACVKKCPTDAITGLRNELHIIDPVKCIDCGACEPECPVTALFTEEDTPDEWHNYIEKNKAYLEGGDERTVATGAG